MTENSVRHSMTPTYNHTLNLGVIMSYNIGGMLLTRFLLSSDDELSSKTMPVSCLVGELSSSHTQDRYANNISRINTVSVYEFFPQNLS